MSGAALTVRRARVRDARGDPLSAQLRVGRLLAAADATTGLPAGSLLVVRSLADPLPGALAAQPHALRPPRAWERALRESLLALARAAARPALGPVPAGAVAVFFADEAELLACLARDAAAGTAPGRWWWTPLLPAGAPPAAALARRLVARPAAVPAAVERLAAAGRLAELAALLDDTTAEAVVRAVAERFAIEVEAGGRRAADGPLPRPALPSPSSALRLQPTRFPSRALEQAIRARAPEVSDLAAPAAVRTLVALALVLRRAPSLARSPGFAEALAGAACAPATPPGAAPRPAPAGSAAGPERRSPAPPRHPRRELAAPAAPLLEAPEPESAPVPAPAPPPAARAALLSAERQPRPAAEAGQAAVVTSLGGVLFLANVAISLGLYGDFTRPRRPGIGLDFWRFLSLLAARLLAPRPVRRDPVWALLAGLARPDAPRWRPPRRLPPAWLAPLTPRDRALLDRARGDDLERWIAQVAVCVRGRLRAAGVDAGTLLQRPARVTVTDLHVDTAFALSSHPVEIRLAGLDRDPGWIPAAGRTVAFHFE